MGVTYTLALLVQRNGLAAKISSLLEQSSRSLPYPSGQRSFITSLPWSYELKSPISETRLFDYLYSLEKPTDNLLPERDELIFYDISIKFSSERFENPPRKIELSLNYKSEFQGTYGDPRETLVLNIDTYSSSYHHAQPSPPEQLLVDVIIATLDPIYGFSSDWERLLSEQLKSLTPWERYRHTMFYGLDLTRKIDAIYLRSAPAYEVRELLGPMFFIVSPLGLLANEWPVDFEGMDVRPLDNLLRNELHRHEVEVIKYLNLISRF